MANDGSVASLVEAWIATTLAALQDDGSDVFATAEVWAGQISAQKSGIEAFVKYAPFAFVGYLPDYAGREGDFDLRRVLEFAVMIGQVDETPGVARFGSDSKLGTNMIEQLVIAALDGKHPGSGITCDDLKYVGTTKWIDLPKASAVQLNFNCSLMVV